MATVLKVKSVEQFNQHLKNAPESSLVAINFHAPWALPCTQMNQVFESLAQQASAATSVFISVDAEEFPEISESYDVTVVPYFVLIKARAIIKKISGADPKELSDSITKLSGAATAFSLPPPQKTTAAPLEDDPAAPAEGEEEDINTRLAKLVKAAPVMLFMKGTPGNPQCGFSSKLVALLREREVRYGFFNILADEEVRQGLKAFSDWPTFPQLYVNGNLIGGLDIVKEEFENDPDFLKNLSTES